MKNVATHETSLRLKAAGFPQPEPEAGQVWYDGNGDLFCIQATEYNTHGPDYIHGFFIGDDHSGFCEPLSPEDVFAPTAADILRHLDETKLQTATLRSGGILRFIELIKTPDKLAELWPALAQEGYWTNMRFNN